MNHEPQGEHATGERCVTIGELEQRARVSRQAVHGHVAASLIPPPTGSKRTPCYRESDVAILRGLEAANLRRYTVHQVAAAANLRPATIHSYVERCLLPPPCGPIGAGRTGRGAYYTDLHVEGVRVIRRELEQVTRAHLASLQAEYGAEEAKQILEEQEHCHVDDYWRWWDRVLDEAEQRPEWQRWYTRCARKSPMWD